MDGVMLKLGEGSAPGTAGMESLQKHGESADICTVGQTEPAGTRGHRREKLVLAVRGMRSDHWEC